MTVLDAVASVASVAANSYVTVQPAAGVEWILHNLGHNGDISIEFYDGTYSLIFDSAYGAGIYAKYAFHLTNQVYLRVKNTYTATTAFISYNGVVSKG